MPAPRPPSPRACRAARRSRRPVRSNRTRALAENDGAGRPAAVAAAVTIGIIAAQAGRAGRAGVVAVGEAPGAPKGRLGGAADQDRQDVLDGSRPEGEVLERVEPAMERLGRARPQVAPEPDRLVEVRAAHVETVGHRQVPELGRVPADADPGRDPAATQRVERGQLLGEQDRVPLRDHDHARAEADAGMPAGEPGQGQDRLVDAPVLGLGGVGHDDVIGRPDRRPAEPLGDAPRRHRVPRPTSRHGSWAGTGRSPSLDGSGAGAAPRRGRATSPTRTRDTVGLMSIFGAPERSETRR